MVQLCNYLKVEILYQTILLKLLIFKNAFRKKEHKLVYFLTKFNAIHLHHVFIRKIFATATGLEPTTC